ncbi:MAG: phytanoyl-CoA dioxygenase family protein, partial [Lentisphaeria bacterium]|nr:phytanoyl-CoA dioxygenase family protein [Lentisphaeria bacterium]
MINTDPSEYPAAGYCLFPDLFNAEQVAAMQHGLDLAILASFKGLPNYYGEPHTTEALWLKTCINPKLLDAVELLLGPNLILVYSSMFIKVARDEKIVHWHQDNSYWESVHGTDVLTVWLAIDDVEDD